MARFTTYSLEQLERRRLLSMAIASYNPSTSLQPLIDALVVPNTGITVNSGSSSYVGQNAQGGTFTGLSATSGSTTLSLPDGVILTSGLASIAFNKSWNTPGDSNLTAITTMSTHDANAIILQFTTSPGTTSISFDFVYGTYDGTLDGFGAFLDGTSITHNASGHAISNDSSFVRSNPYTATIGYGELTVALRTMAPLDPNVTTHTLKLVAADCGDSSVDSGVFLANLRGSTATVVDATSPVPTAGSLQFDQSTVSTNTATPSVSITVDRVGGSTGAATIDYATSNGAAIAGTDYTNTHGTLSFVDGQTTATISVPLLDNAAGSASSDFALTLSNPTGGAQLGTPLSTTVTIQNNKSVLHIGATTYTGTTDDPHVVLTVLRAGNLSQAATISYSTLDGTAAAGTDYTAAQGVLSFAASQASQTIDISLLDDAAAASSTQFTLTLASPAGNGVLISPATATISILNGHSVVQFDAPAYTIDESASGITITVTRAGNLAADASVTYATIDGTAIAGANYVASMGTLVFTSGQSAASFTVPVTQDLKVDPTLDFGVSLSAPAGTLLLGAQSTSAVSITDFTPPPTVSGIALTPATARRASSAAIASTLMMTFDQTLASTPTRGNFHLYLRSHDRASGKGAAHSLPIAITSYDASSRVLILKPQRALHANRFYQLVATGSAAQSENGSLLDGHGAGVAGTSFSYYFGNGKRLSYVDRAGNRVNLVLQGPGSMNLVRGSDGQGDNLTLAGATAATVLTGTVRLTHMGGAGATTLATVSGLGAATNHLPANMFVMN